MKLSRLLLSAMLFAAVSCAPRERTITIIAVNDVHGSIDNFPRLATLVERYRQADPSRVVVLDAGDRWTGNPYVDMYPERGLPVIELENKLGIDLATHGNHEFDFGLDVLTERVKQSRVPYVVANLDSNGSSLPQPPATFCIDAGGVKLCFIGLITTSRAGYPDGFVENFGTIKFSNPLSTALKYKHMKDSCDVLIALTHIGFELDSILATQMPELDLILGGHSHTVVGDDKFVGRTLVTQTGSRLKYANVITLTMRGGELQKVSGRLVGLDTITPDPAYAAMVDKYYENPAMLEVVGGLATPLTKTGVMNLVTDMIRNRVGTDMVLYNWGGIRVDSLPAGPVTVARVLAMEPFGNTVHILDMTPAQLSQLILNKFNSQGGESHQEDLSPSGFTYKIVTDSRGDGIRVDIDTRAKLSPRGTYRVAMSDYVAQSYAFDLAGTGRPTDIVVSGLIIDHLKKHGTVSSDNQERVGIVRQGADQKLKK